MDKNDIRVEDNSCINSLVHLFASTSKHAYPALLDLIEYLDKLQRIPTKIPFETLNTVFIITLNFAESDEDMLFIYTRWIKFLLKFSENPFETDVFSALPDRIKNANEKTTKITDLLTEYWSTDYTSEDKTYKGIIESKENTPQLELLKFLNDDNYKPELSSKAKDGYMKNPDDATMQILNMLFEKYYYDDNTEEALALLNHFPRNWKTFWNAHICNPRSNEYIDALIFLMTKDQNLVEHQDVLILQLELKMLVNDVEGYLDEGELITPEIIKEISEELEEDLNDLDSASEEIVDKFTNKLYEKAVFNKTKAIYRAIPEELSQEHLTSIYIDLKKVLEFCEDHGIEKSSSTLKEINRVLFEELKDVDSGVNLVCKMLNTNAHMKMSQYLLKLAYILEPNSFEMDTLYECFVRHITRQKLSTRQLKMYTEIFEKITHPQFEILKEMLITFHKDENNITKFINVVLKNINIYYSHSQSFYVTMDSVFHSKLDVKTVQKFIGAILSSSLKPDLTKIFAYQLVDYLHEQPYINLKKGFPKTEINESILSVLYKTLDDIVDQSMEDSTYEQEFETKQYSIDECRAFLYSLTMGKTVSTGAR